jgi:hypothetical protein
VQALLLAGRRGSAHKHCGVTDGDERCGGGYVRARECESQQYADSADGERWEMFASNANREMGARARWVQVEHGCQL